MIDNKTKELRQHKYNYFPAHICQLGAMAPQVTPFNIVKAMKEHVVDAHVQKQILYPTTGYMKLATE
jgi:hypothetical protein